MHSTTMLSTRRILIASSCSNNLSFRLPTTSPANSTSANATMQTSVPTISPTSTPRYDISANCTLQTTISPISARSPNVNGDGGGGTIWAVTGSVEALPAETV